MSDMLRVEVDNGKYTVVQDSNGRLTALRHGEEWRDCVGDSLIYCMAAELEQLRAENAALKAMVRERSEHDMALAEKVLEAVYKTGWCSSNIYDDDVLDLTAIVRGECEEG